MHGVIEGLQEDDGTLLSQVKLDALPKLASLELAKISWRSTTMLKAPRLPQCDKRYVLAFQIVHQT